MKETMNVIQEIKKLKLYPVSYPDGIAVEAKSQKPICLVDYEEHNRQVDMIIEYLQEQFFILDGFLRPLTGETIPKE